MKAKKRIDFSSAFRHANYLALRCTDLRSWILDDSILIVYVWSAAELQAKNERDVGLHLCIRPLAGSEDPWP
jgi:hypothetical protein